MSSDRRTPQTSTPSITSFEDEVGNVSKKDAQQSQEPLKRTIQNTMKKMGVKMSLRDSRGTQTLTGRLQGRQQSAVFGRLAAIGTRRAVLRLSEEVAAGRIRSSHHRQTAGPATQVRQTHSTVARRAQRHHSRSADTSLLQHESPRAPSERYRRAGPVRGRVRTAHPTPPEQDH